MPASFYSCDFGLDQADVKKNWVYVILSEDIVGKANGKEVLEAVCEKILTAPSPSSYWPKLAAANKSNLQFEVVPGAGCVPRMKPKGANPIDHKHTLYVGQVLYIPEVYQVKPDVLTWVGSYDNTTWSYDPIDRLTYGAGRLPIKPGQDSSEPTEEPAPAQESEKSSSILPILGVTALGILGTWWILKQKK